MNFGRSAVVLGVAVGLAVTSFGTGLFYRELMPVSSFLGIVPEKGRETSFRRQNNNPDSACFSSDVTSENVISAQWWATFAAEDRAFWAKISLWVATAGSILLLLQIKLTRVAIVDSRKSLKLAERSIEITEMVGQKQVMAYVSPSKLTLKFGMKGEIYCSVILKNSGQSPALNVLYSVHCDVLRG